MSENVTVNYRFDDAIFNDTLFEGELLKNNNDEWIFIIINLHLFKGELQRIEILFKI